MRRRRIDRHRYLRRNPNACGSVEEHGIGLAYGNPEPSEHVLAVQRLFGDIFEYEAFIDRPLVGIAHEPNTPGGELLSEDQAWALAVGLEAIGIGIAPDVRCGGPDLDCGDDQVVFFPLPKGAHVGWSVGNYDVDLSGLAATFAFYEPEAPDLARSRLEEYLRGEPSLTRADALRASMHLEWWLLHPPSDEELTAQLSEVKSDALVARLLDAAAPLEEQPRESSARVRQSGDLTLDRRLLSRLVSETERVQERLCAPSSSNLPTTLSEDERGFLVALACSPQLDRVDFDRRARDLGLMPVGFIDRLNAMALDLCESLIFEGCNPININCQVLKELLDETDHRASA